MAGPGFLYLGESPPTAYELPPLQIPHDELAKSLQSRVGEIVHRRDGLLLGARVYAERRRWRCKVRQPQEVIDELQGFWQARRFKLLPDAAVTGTYIVVHWVEPDFLPERLRGAADAYDLEFTIEEV